MNTISKITTTNIDEVKNILAIYGVCVLERVFDKELSEKTFERMIHDLEKRTRDMENPFVFEKKKTWKYLKRISSYRGMMYKHGGISQAKYVWKVRTNSSILETFSKIYDTEELIVSFDGISLSLPGNDYDTDKWYHIDHSLTDLRKKCVQGMLMLKKVRQEDATVCVLIKSHKLISKYARKKIKEFSEVKKTTDSMIQKKFGENWNRIEPEYFTEKGCEELRVSCKSGSLILFDSKTVHYGALPLEGREKENTKACIYLSYSPVENIKNYTFSPKIFAERSLKYYQEGRYTSHWAEYRKIGPESLVVNRQTIDISDLYCPKIKKPNKKMLQLITGIYK